MINTSLITISIAGIVIITWLIIDPIISFGSPISNTKKEKIIRIFTKAVFVLLVIELIMLIFEIIDFFITG